LHSTQCARETRSGVEAAGIAHAIKTNTEMFKAFDQDDGSPSARTLARKAFKPAVLFPKDIPIMVRLGMFYDTASLLSHTNAPTFVRHLAPTSTPGIAAFSFQDFPRERIEEELPTFMFWLCSAHLSILMVPDIIFPNIAPELSTFAADRKAVFERLSRFAEQFKSQSRIGNVEVPGLPRSR
jgi:hypothetical protein